MRAADAGQLPDADSAPVWVEVLNPGDKEFAALQERFGLLGQAVSESMRSALVPKIDVYEDQILVALKTARLEGDGIEYAGLHAFVSPRHVITVRYGDAAAPHSAPRIGSRHRPDFVLHAVMEAAVSSYLPVVEMIEDEVFAMERHLLDAFLERDKIKRLFRLRREAIHLQHVITGMADVCSKLANLEVPCIGAEARSYFRDLHDRLVRLNAMTGGLVEVIRAVFEASNLLEQQRQGTTTRQLAAWAAILGVPAAIAGVYGVGAAHATGPQAAYGYPAVLAVMLVICVALYARFRMLRWL